MTDNTEFLHPSEVRPDIANAITELVTEVAEALGSEAKSWYHDQPLWYVGDNQIGLTRQAGKAHLEVHRRIYLDESERSPEDHTSLGIEKMKGNTLKEVLRKIILAE